MCSIHFFSTANLSCSFDKNTVTTSIHQSLKHEPRYNQESRTWLQHLVLKFDFGSKSGTSIEVRQVSKMAGEGYTCNPEGLQVRVITDQSFDQFLLVQG
jgi:hypothetical protein